MTDILLLGAGASMDAGLPSAFELTDRVLQRLAAKSEQSAVDVLTFVSDGLRAHESTAGGDRDSRRIDSEALFRSVQLLASRGDAELAPFVASWDPRLIELSAGDRIPGEVFRQAASAMLVAISDTLWGTERDIEYFEPLRSLLQRQDRVTVATVNYDSLIEKFCGSHGLPFDQGVSKLVGYFVGKAPEISFADSGINLVKLHGSLDWTFHQPPTASLGFFPTKFASTGWGDTQPPYDKMQPGATPALLFGGGNKLIAEGPFLDLFMKFRTDLRQATRLIIVGYSFRDAHVNNEIGWFVNLAPARKVIIVDPVPPVKTRFLADLLIASGDRATVIPRSAREGLAMALALNSDVT